MRQKIQPWTPMVEPSKRLAPANCIEDVPRSILGPGSLPYEAPDGGRHVPQRVFSTISGQSLAQDFERAVRRNAGFDQIADHEQCDRCPVPRITAQRGNQLRLYAPSQRVGTGDHPWSLGGWTEEFSSPTHAAGKLGEGGHDEVGGNAFGGSFEGLVVDGTYGYAGLSRFGHDGLDPSHRIGGIGLPQSR